MDNVYPGCDGYRYQIHETEFSNEEFDTIGGLVMQALGHMPSRNEVAVIDKFEFKVINADQRKVHSLRMRPLES